MKRSFILCCLLAPVVLATGCGADATATAPHTSGPTATATLVPIPGSIAGSLMYPADSIPPLQVFAVNVADAHRYSSVKTSAGQLDFAIAGVLPGTYHLLAYVQAGYMTGNAKVFAGGYTNEVACELTPAPGCDDHTLINVTVHPSEAVTGVRLWDWYAPPGIFPPPPGS